MVAWAFPTVMWVQPRNIQLKALVALIRVIKMANKIFHLLWAWIQATTRTTSSIFHMHIFQVIMNAIPLLVPLNYHMDNTKIRFTVLSQQHQANHSKHQKCRYQVQKYYSKMMRMEAEIREIRIFKSSCHSIGHKRSVVKTMKVIKEILGYREKVGIMPWTTI